jgi:hypothetical protein
VVHYELGNFDLLEYIVRSTQRFLNKHHRAYQMEVLLIEHIKKLARTQVPSAKRELFRSLHDQLARLLKDPNESLVFKYFDFLSWVNSKIEGISFSDAVRGGSRKELVNDEGPSIAGEPPVRTNGARRNGPVYRGVEASSLTFTTLNFGPAVLLILLSRCRAHRSGANGFTGRPVSPGAVGEAMSRSASTPERADEVSPPPGWPVHRSGPGLVIPRVPRQSRVRAPSSHVRFGLSS